MDDTLTEQLRQYAIGARIKALRISKRIGLVELGRHSGLSAGLLSKIERGLLMPPLPTLLRIAMVFGVGLDHFFVQRSKPAAVIVRRKDRIRLPDDPKRREPAYVFESLDYPATDQPMEAYLAEFHSASLEHRHPGPELIYVIKGQLVVQLEEEKFRLGAGDSMTFDCTIPHSYYPERRVACVALVVVSRIRGQGTRESISS